MTLNQLIALLEDYRLRYMNYEVELCLDHFESPEIFYIEIDDEEKRISIVQGNCGI